VAVLHPDAAGVCRHVCLRGYAVLCKPSSHNQLQWLDLVLPRMDGRQQPQVLWRGGGGRCQFCWWSMAAPLRQILPKQTQPMRMWVGCLQLSLWTSALQNPARALHVLVLGDGAAMPTNECCRRRRCGELLRRSSELGGGEAAKWMDMISVEQRSGAACTPTQQLLCCWSTGTENQSLSELHWHHPLVLSKPC